MASESLLSSLYPPADLRAYLTRQRRSPQAGMRRVDPVPGGFACWSYADHRWTRRAVVRDRCEALTWWLADPWLPSDPFGPPAGEPPGRSGPADESPGRSRPADESPGRAAPADAAVLAGGSANESAGESGEPAGEPGLEPGMQPGPSRGPESGSGPVPPAETLPVTPRWTETRWQEAALALSFHVVMETGARPHDVGPESTETGALVYQRLADRDAAAQIYWYEGRSLWEDLRASCPVRTDIPPMLRCAVLAEAAVLLGRRPHVYAYIGMSKAPAGVAPEAARILGNFGVPPEIYPLLLRR